MPSPFERVTKSSQITSKLQLKRALRHKLNTYPRALSRVACRSHSSHQPNLISHHPKNEVNRRTHPKLPLLPQPPQGPRAGSQRCVQAEKSRYYTLRTSSIDIMIADCRSQDPGHRKLGRCESTFNPPPSFSFHIPQAPDSDIPCQGNWC